MHNHTWGKEIFLISFCCSEDNPGAQHRLVLPANQLVLSSFTWWCQSARRGLRCLLAGKQKGCDTLLFMSCVCHHQRSPVNCRNWFSVLPLHFRIKSFEVPEIVSESPVQDTKGGDGEQPFHPPEIVPLYGVSSKMVPLFQESGYK